jgi:hypothetical protein
MVFTALIPHTHPTSRIRVRYDNHLITACVFSTYTSGIRDFTQDRSSPSHFVPFLFHPLTNLVRIQSWIFLTKLCPTSKIRLSESGTGTGLSQRKEGKSW